MGRISGQFQHESQVPDNKVADHSEPHRASPSGEGSCGQNP